MGTLANGGGMPTLKGAELCRSNQLSTYKNAAQFVDLPIFSRSQKPGFLRKSQIFNIDAEFIFSKRHH